MALTLLGFFVLFFSSSLVHADVVHVRVLDDRAASILVRARSESPIVANLISQIESSDVVVFLQTSIAPQRAGATKFVGASGGFRYLRVTLALPWDIPPKQAAAGLGHELQHVLEAASAPAVVDERSFKAFFMRIGHSGTRPRGSVIFETDQAGATEDAIVREIDAVRRSVSAPTHVQAHLDAGTEGSEAERHERRQSRRLGWPISR